MSEWDEGQVFVPFQVASTDPSAFEHRFKEFLRDFREGNAFVYRDRLRQNLNQGYSWLLVNLEDLIAVDEDLADKLKQRPSELLPLFSSAAKEIAKENVRIEQRNDVPDIQILLETSQNTIPIRALVSSHVSKLVAVSGIIISASRKQAKATSLTIMCRNCFATKIIPCKSGFAGAQLPRTCDAQQEAATGTSQPRASRCPLDPFEIITDRSIFVDHQTLKLQEDPETIPTGEMPRQIMLSLERNLVDRVVPGSRVTVLGIYTIIHSHSKKSGGVQQPYIRVIGIKSEGSGRVNKIFKPEEEEQFNRLAKTPDLYNHLVKGVAPAIYGHVDIKKAILCQLFGGSRKHLPDGMRLRGDINILLLGDPGTAKSQMLKFVEKVAPIGVYTSGKGSSAAGLTASVVKEKGTREFYLEGGAMVLADCGIVCIDEFDKMRLQDRVAIHEAMEQQTISIAKAGITTILNSRTAVLAAANPVFGRYDELRSAEENIDFQSTILSRFDLIFLVKDHLNEDIDKKIAYHVMEIHSRTHTDTESEIPLLQLKRYVAFCRAKCTPRLSQAAAEVLKNHYVSIRSAVRNKNSATNSTGKTTIPITVRQLEAIVRISEALARMTLSPVATEEHVNEAIRLFNISTFEAATSGQIVTETLSPTVMSEIQNAETLLKRRLPIGSHISEKQVIDDFVRQGISEFAVRKAIGILVQRSELEYRNQRRRIYRIC